MVPSKKCKWNKSLYHSTQSIANGLEAIRTLLLFNNNEKHLSRNHPNHDRLHNIGPSTYISSKRNIFFFSHRSTPLKRRTYRSHIPKQNICLMWPYGIRIPFRSVFQTRRQNKWTSRWTNVVSQLARVILRTTNHIAFFDHFYTSLALAYYLAKQGIHCVGTLQQNRLRNCRLADKEHLKKTTIPSGT